MFTNVPVSSERVLLRLSQFACLTKKGAGERKVTEVLHAGKTRVAEDQGGIGKVLWLLFFFNGGFNWFFIHFQRRVPSLM